MDIIWIIALIARVLLAWGIWTLANRRGRDHWSWFVIPLAFGALGAIIMAALLYYKPNLKGQSKDYDLKLGDIGNPVRVPRRQPGFRMGSLL